MSNMMPRLVKRLLFASALTLAPLAAHAQVVDDPLHGACNAPTGCGGDNPLLLTNPSNFGFTASPTQSGTLEIAILVPQLLQPSFGLGAISGTGINGSLNLTSDGEFSSGDLSTVLGLPPPPGTSPNNPFSAFNVGLDTSVSSFSVYDVVVPTTLTLTGPGSPLADVYSEAGAVPAGTDYVAFLVNSSVGGNTATAPSGQLQLQTGTSSTPLPGAVWMFGGGLAFLGLLRRKRRNRATPVSALA